jgi:hypothetical protein
MQALNYGNDLIDALGGGMVDEQTKDWIAQRGDGFYSALGERAQQFFSQAKQIHQTISESQAMQMLRNAKSKLDSLWVSNQIQALYDMAQFQTASLTMQRWVMAEETLRRKYLHQEVDGYSDSYKNLQGNAVGEAQYDWRRVMDGVGRLEGDDYILKRYQDYLPEGERELTSFEKLDVLDSWARVRHILEEGGEDPTSLYGNML